MIVIFTHTKSDVTLQRLVQVLQERGAAHIVLDPDIIEDKSSLLIEKMPSGAVNCSLRLPGGPLRLSEVRSAWIWRSWQRFEEEPKLLDLATKPREWAFYRAEWVTFCRGLTLTLAYLGVFCVNRPPFNLAFEEKCCQLFLAAKVGLDIPSTLFTARPSLAREFHETLGESIIYKPFRTYAHVIETAADQPIRTSILYTSRVDPEDLVESADDIPTPGIFQPYIEKAFELRVVIVGRRLFACAIHSQQSEVSRDDWRRYDLENTPYEPHELPADIAAKLRALMDELDLVYGCIDMIVTPDGKYVFLEINPNGQFDWVAQRTGLPIYEALADLLIAGECRPLADVVA